MTEKRFLFEECIDIGFEGAQIKVYRLPIDIYSNSYECVIDTDESLEIARDYDGRWFDHQSGRYQYR